MVDHANKTFDGIDFQVGGLEGLASIDVATGMGMLVDPVVTFNVENRR